MIRVDSKMGDTEPLVPPLVTSSVFRFRDVEHVVAVSSGEEPGYIYARDAHPNADRLAKILASREHAERGLVVSSGMAALSVALLGLCKQGDHIAAGSQLYGKTTRLLSDGFGGLGINCLFFDSTDKQEWAKALSQKPKVVLVETLSNPTLRAVELEELPQQCSRAGSKLVVDATFTPPPMLRAIEMGADIVVHSLTKFISGHGDVTLGFLAGNNDCVDQLAKVASTWGYHASAFDCWMTERGIETLDIRWQKACENARKVAERLRSLPGIERVIDPGDEGHPDHRWLKEHANGFGNMLAFEVAGGAEAVNRLFGRFQHILFCPSLGDVRTTVSYPWSTSHVALSDDEKRLLGVTPGLVRLSVGIEPFQVLEADFTQALAV